MPCDSRITRTKLTDADRLMKALDATGHKATMDARKLSISTDFGSFTRSRADGAFDFAPNYGAERNPPGAVMRKYAEIGVRAWAERSGFSITENDGRRMQLVNRRGGK